MLSITDVRFCRQSRQLPLNLDRTLLFMTTGSSFLPPLNVTIPQHCSLALLQEEQLLRCHTISNWLKGHDLKSFVNI